MGRFLDALLRRNKCLYCAAEVIGDDAVRGGGGTQWCNEEHYDLDQASRF